MNINTPVSHCELKCQAAGQYWCCNTADLLQCIDQNDHVTLCYHPTSWSKSMFPIFLFPMSDTTSDTAESQSGSWVSPQVTSTITNITEYLNCPKAKSKSKKTKKNGKKRSQYVLFTAYTHLTFWEIGRTTQTHWMMMTQDWWNLFLLPLTGFPFLLTPSSTWGTSSWKDWKQYLFVLLNALRCPSKYICYQNNSGWMSDSNQHYKTIIFQKIMKLIPGFLTLVSDFWTNLATYDIFIKQVVWQHIYHVYPLIFLLDEQQNVNNSQQHYVWNQKGSSEPHPTRWPKLATLCASWHLVKAQMGLESSCHSATAMPHALGGRI